MRITSWFTGNVPLVTDAEIMNAEPDDGFTSMDTVGLASEQECIVLFSVGMPVPELRPSPAARAATGGFQRGKLISFGGISAEIELAVTSCCASIGVHSVASLPSSLLIFAAELAGAATGLYQLANMSARLRFVPSFGSLPVSALSSTFFNVAGCSKGMSPSAAVAFVI